MHSFFSILKLVSFEFLFSLVCMDRIVGHFMISVYNKLDVFEEDSAIAVDKFGGICF